MSESFKGYRDLQVWQKATPLVKDIYQATAKFPSEEKFGIVNQIRGSAVAIPSNIAGGTCWTRTCGISASRLHSDGFNCRAGDTDPP